MKPVRLNHPLVLEEAQIQSDGAGGLVAQWAALGTLWAELRAGSGRERLAEMGPQGRAGFRIIVRAAAQGSPARPRPDQRFRSGARLFRILAVAELDPRGAYLTCFAEEELPG